MYSYIKNVKIKKTFLNQLKAVRLYILKVLKKKDTPCGLLFSEMVLENDHFEYSV
jgi:hypothetical protein